MGGRGKRSAGCRGGLEQRPGLPEGPGWEATCPHCLDSGESFLPLSRLPWALVAQESMADGVQGWVGSREPGNWPQPRSVGIPADRTRPDLISEDLQRQFVQEVVQSQQVAVSRQLEDFRSKRLMGMTPWEPDLAQLESWVGRDRAAFEARERHVAERLLAHLEEMQ